MEIYHFMEVS